MFVDHPKIKVFGALFNGSLLRNTMGKINSVSGGFGISAHAEI